MKLFKASLCSLAVVLLCCSFCFFDTGHSDLHTDAERFQQEYMSQNAKLDEHFHFMRKLEINKENPMVYSSFENVLQRLDNQESFYVYFGFAKCPWCRALVSPMLTAAADCDISQILYIDLSTSRDLYILKDGIPVQFRAGADGYTEVLERFSALLDNYTLSDSHGVEIPVGEKRIYAPTLIRVQDGQPVRIYTGSSKLTDAYAPLSDDVLDDMLTGLRILFAP